MEGFIAGWIGAFCVYPIDYIKTHVQNNIKIKTLKHVYRGSFIQLIGIGPEKAIKLHVNSSGLEYGFSPLISGALAGMSQVIISNPIEYIKIKYQMNQLNQINFKHIYKGVGYCLARDIPFSSIYFVTYDYLKQNNFSSSVSGLIAGIPAAYLVTPFDVIKTRIQSNVPLPTKFKDYWRGGLWRVAKSAPQFSITLTTYEYIKNINNTN